MNLNELPKVKHILVIVGHFMRYTRTYVTKDQKVSTATKTLYRGFISIFGAPKRILADQRKAFTRWINELVKYDFSLKYQKGKNNTVADALSRISEEHLSDKESL